jgi:magnesium transporter
MRIFLARGGKLETENGIDWRSLPEAIKDPSVSLWVDMDKLDDDEIELLAEGFSFHPLAIEDCIHARSRPKIEEYEGYLFIVIRSVDGRINPEGLDTTQLSVFLGTNYAVTVHSGSARGALLTKERLEANPQLLSKGPDVLAHSILDVTIDNYLPVLDEMDDHLDRLEDRIFTNFTPDALEDIFAIKKDVLHFRRLVGPQRDMFNVLSHREYPQIKPETRAYFRDIYDHLVRLVDMLEVYRDILTGAFDSYISQVQNRTNEVIKRLTIVATVLLPLSFLAGIFGMNFKFLPGLEHPAGPWVLIGIMVTLGVGMIFYFRKKKWV